MITYSYNQFTTESDWFNQLIMESDWFNQLKMESDWITNRTTVLMIDLHTWNADEMTGKKPRVITLYLENWWIYIYWKCTSLMYMHKMKALYEYGCLRTKEPLSSILYNTDNSRNEHCRVNDKYCTSTIKQQTCVTSEFYPWNKMSESLFLVMKQSQKIGQYLDFTLTVPIIVQFVLVCE